MKRSMPSVLVRSMIGWVVLLMLHVLLLRYMGGRDVASRILAMGDHVPPLMAWTAILFLAIRLLTVLILPGLILMRLGLELFRRLEGAAKNNTS